MVKRFLIFLIKGYQKFISPLLGDNCRFYPTCSAYAIEALRVHGALKGSLLAAWRILRCNPFGPTSHKKNARAQGRIGQRI